MNPFELGIGMQRGILATSEAALKSLSEKWELVGGEGFWLGARRTVPRPALRDKEWANEAHRQKHRRRLVPIFQKDSKLSQSVLDCGGAPRLFRRRHCCHPNTCRLSRTAPPSRWGASLRARRGCLHSTALPPHFINIIHKACRVLPKPSVPPRAPLHNPAFTLSFIGLSATLVVKGCIQLFSLEFK